MIRPPLWKFEASGKIIPQDSPSGIFFPEEFPEASSCGILEFLHERTLYVKFALSANFIVQIYA